MDYLVFCYGEHFHLTARQLDEPEEVARFHYWLAAEDLRAAAHQRQRP